MRREKIKLVTKYKNEYYLLDEYENLAYDDYLRLKYAWIRKIKRELKIKPKEFYIEKLTESDRDRNITIYNYSELTESEWKFYNQRRI